MMKVILLEDVANLGVVGDLVSVRDGYGRNFLIPRKKAVFASVRSVAELEHQKRLAAHRRSQATATAQQGKKRIESLSVVMTARVAPPQMGEDGLPVVEKLPKLFGTITTRDLSRFLDNLGVKVDHRRIVVNATIRTVGKYEAHVRLDGGVDAKLPFWVIAEGVADIDAEKRRVEAAQEALRKEHEAVAAAEAAAAAASVAEAKRQAKEAAKAREAAKEQN